MDMINELDWGFYATTSGTYIVKDDDNNLVVAYACDHTAPRVIDVEGQDLFIVYLTGDMSQLLTWVAKEAVRYVIFERNGDNVIRKYDLHRLQRLIRMPDTP